MKQTNKTRYEVALVFTFVLECYFSFDTAISHWVGHALVAVLLLEGLGIVLFILLGVLLLPKCGILVLLLYHWSVINT